MALKRKFTQHQELGSVCSDLRELLLEIVQLKRSKSAVEVLRQRLGDGSLRLLDLRRVNRAVTVQLDKCVDETLSANLRLDHFNLQLKNLEYEKNHLRKDIQRCKDFKFSIDELDMIPNEDFLRANEQATDEHQHMLNRLSFEKAERVRLCAKFEELNNAKVASTNSNKTNMEALDSLHVELDNLLKAASPIQAGLSCHVMVGKEEQVLSQSLPKPLYILYHEMVAYRDAYEQETVGVQIHGDHTAALSAAPGDVARKHKRQRNEEVLDDDLDISSVDEKFPLSVRVQVNALAGDRFRTPLQLDFAYLSQLGVVAVTVLSSHSKKTLTNLFPNDTGLTSPNPANKFLAEGGEFRIDESQSYRMYRWAQYLAGLNFAQAPGVVQTSGGSTLSSNFVVRRVVGQVRARMNTRMSLREQVDKLKKYHLPFTEVNREFPLKAVAKLTSFDGVDPDDFTKAGDWGLVGSSDSWADFKARYYRGTFLREKTTLVFFVQITPEYPVRAPLFKLELLNHGKKMYDNNIRVMEEEVNVHFGELSCPDENDLLAYQVRKLQFCFDVHMETKERGDASILSNKICLRRTRGRNRAKPFIVSSMGLLQQRS